MIEKGKKKKKGIRIASRENTLVFLHFLNESFNKVEKILSKLHNISPWIS